MGPRQQSAIDAIRDKIRITSVTRQKGVIVIRVKSLTDLAHINGKTRYKRTDWALYPAMAYKLIDGLEFRTYLREVPVELKMRSTEVS